MASSIDNPGSTPDQSRLHKPMQFGLGTLVGAVVVSAVVLAILRFDAGLGMFAGFIVLAGGVVWRFRLLTPPTLLEVLVVVLIIGLMIGLLVPWCSHGRNPARRTQCRNNLKQIGLALLNYHDVYGSFPPAIIRNEDGKPMHSWRVLILPYLEQTVFYNAYRFDEPWDSPHNRTLAQYVPDVYLCPADQPLRPAWRTNYVAIMGDETAWPTSGVRGRSEITDGLDETILVVEVAGSGIHWMEPRDLHVLQMTTLINPAAGQGISSRHPGGANILFADGTVRFLPDTIDVEAIAALRSVSGSEKFMRDRKSSDTSDWKLQSSRKPQANAK